MAVSTVAKAQVMTVVVELLVDGLSAVESMTVAHEAWLQGQVEKLIPIGGSIVWEFIAPELPKLFALLQAELQALAPAAPTLTQIAQIKSAVVTKALA